MSTRNVVDLFGLTASEARVLGHVMEGLSNTEIANVEGRSLSWAKYKVGILLARAGVEDRPKLMAKAWGAGWGMRRPAIEGPLTLSRGRA